MKKIDKTVLRETIFVIIGTVILSCLLNAVYLIIKLWNTKVLFGNILGAAVAVLNFFLMALTVQSALGKDEKAIKTRVQFSLLFRMLFIFGIALAVHFLPKHFDLITYLISLLFPRITILFRGFIKLPNDNVSDAAKEDETPGESSKLETSEENDPESDE